MSNQTRIAWKEWQIDCSCRLMNRLSDLMTWTDHHFSTSVCDLLYRLYWLLDDLLKEWFNRAYEGSWSEIEQAWEFSDEDWLTDFQRLVADGRILPYDTRYGI